MITPKHIVVVRTDAIGDMVVTLPAIKALKTKFPQAKLTVLASAYNKPVIDHLPYIDQIITELPSRFFKLVSFLKGLKADVIVHYRLNPNLVWASLLAKIPYRLGDKALLSLWPALRKHGTYYKSHRIHTHVVEYSFLLLAPLGITLSETDDIDLPVPIESIDAAKTYLETLGWTGDKPLIGLQVGVGFGNRPITPEKFAQFVDALKAIIDVDICINGYTETEIEACNTIESLTKFPVIKALGVPLKEYMGRLSLFDVLVSVDTGPFHLAAGIKTPQLAIFPSKKVRPLNWGPWRNRHFVCRHNINCHYDCPHQGCPYNICSDDINVSDMVEHTLALLKGEGIQGPERHLYWFRTCVNIAVLYDDTCETEAKAYYTTLKKWGYEAFFIPATSSTLFNEIREKNLLILHNFTGKHATKLWLLTQRLINYLFVSPTLIQRDTGFETEAEMFDSYTQAITDKKL